MTTGTNAVDAGALTTPVAFLTGSGVDTLAGGSGNDAFVFATSDLTAADSVNGDGGIDNLYLTSAGTITAAALANVSGWMAYTPAGSEPFFRTHLPESIGLIETVASTLGECLRHAAATLLRAGHGAVCLINSDSPTLPVGYLVAAATTLAAPGDRIVLGPSTDGGYYLIGMKRPHPGLFEDIAWSTDQVLSQTLARAQALGLSVIQLPTWYDVDNAETLQLLVHEVLDGEPFRAVGTPTPATWTRGHLSTLIEDFGLRERVSGIRAAGGLS